MHTLEYSSSRGEIWRWYWRSWAKPRGLWLYHFLISFFITATIALRTIGGFSTSKFLGTMPLAFAACAVIFPVFPQISFKSSVRTLTADPEGIRTSIGSRTGTVAWGKVRTIQDVGSEICISGRGGNAFVIPSRAFASEAVRERFLRDIQSWRAAGDA